MSLAFIPCIQGQSLRYQITAGTALSFISKQNIDATYTPVVLPYASLIYAAQLSAQVAIRSGVCYQQKGFNSHTKFTADNSLDIYNGRSRLHFISIPLQVYIRLHAGRRHGLWVGAGMNYGFLVKADVSIHQLNYRYGRLTNEEQYPLNTSIGLLPVSNRISSNTKYADYKLFTPAVKAEIACELRSRYVLSAYYEYNLYDISMYAAEGILHLHTAGLTLGIGLK